MLEAVRSPAHGHVQGVALAMQRLGMALKLAYNRDGKTGLLRFNYGLLTDALGPSRRPAWGQGPDSSNDTPFSRAAWTSARSDSG